MFEPLGQARVFALPPGVDFPRAVVEGLSQRLADAAPDAWPRVEIYVNTRRMQRRLRAVFDAGGARLLPRIRVVADLGALPEPGVAAPMPPLRRRLELTRLIGRLLDLQPGLAPRAALFDLADSLAGLMDEMQGEGVAPETIAGLSDPGASEHWQRTLEFIRLIEPYFAADAAPDREARQRHVAQRLAERWQRQPPPHPVLVAGSTGSRGATALFMRAVARLPQGALILPGFDFDLPGPVWRGLDDAMAAEDHPQFRFKRLLDDLGLAPDQVVPWTGARAPSPVRNRLVSLALRPAPVTDQWMSDGRRLSRLAEATAQIGLIEAPSARLEAGAIALALRHAAESGRKAALITPDRMLTRQVTAALDRWGIEPDDSAGQPLALSAPGRLLRQVAELFVARLTVESLLALLKHPLTGSGAHRGTHLRYTRDLELHLRRYGPPYPAPADIVRWAERRDPARQAWATWIAGLIPTVSEDEQALADHLDRHVVLAESLAAGVQGLGTGELWAKEAGREASRQVEALRAEADSAGALSATDYASLFHGIMRRSEVREPATPHPDIMIWGTLEARVQGADLVILGGLNEGVWPKTAAADPWLNRKLRHDAGLLLPERQIGLAAHDFQQAVAAREVILSRSLRDAEAQTVPSRWLNRLTNLLGGVSEEGKQALDAMRARGTRWLALADRLDRAEPVAPAPRPSPRPPLADRPGELSITEMQKLVRDPYAIYARRVLRLKPLDPLRQLPDAPVRGSVMHEVMQRFVADPWCDDPDAARTRLIAIAEEVLYDEAPWPAARRIWLAKIARVADWFVAGETQRRRDAVPVALERPAEMRFVRVDLTLRGKIDRIDRAPDGALAIYDYKTGKPPTEKQQRHFDKQLLLSALMAEAGAVTDLDAAPVRTVGYIGLGSRPVFDPIQLDQGQLAQVEAEFLRLVAAYREPDRGYTSRRAMERMAYGGDYDHLARFGEWDETAEPVGLKVGA